MNAVAKLTLFAVALVIVFAGGVAIGPAVGPLDAGRAPIPMEHAP